MSAPSTLIIGAGLSGLAAAQALRSRGCAVKVLEARARLGGRIHTEHGFDLGAHWIHGTEGNPLTNLAHQFRLPLYFVGGDSSYCGSWERLALYDEQGRALDGATKTQSILAGDALRDALEDWRRAQPNGGADLSIAEAVRKILSTRTLSVSAQQHLHWHLELFARDDCAAGPENLSALYWDEGYEVYGYGDSIFLDGYGALIERLAEGLDIALNCQVQQIAYHGVGEERVRVTTARDEFTAARALITLPLGVLKSGAVEFTPPLPHRKQRAIEGLGIGFMTKIGLEFAEPFWPRDQYVFGCVRVAQAQDPTHIINLLPVLQKPMLLMLLGGARGRELETWDETRTREWSMQILRAVFGAGLPEPVKIVRTNWAADPYARGAYSYVATGATPADFAALAEPISDCLYFAGEATSDSQWGSAHGAYASGLREAARLTGDYTLLPARNFTENRRWREALFRASRFFNLRAGELADGALAARTELLAASPVFEKIAHNELRLLATMLEPRELQPGEYLCCEGDAAAEVFIVAAGLLEARDAQGHQRTLGRGALLGEYGLFAQMKRTASVVALEPATVLCLDYQRFTRFLLAFPQTALALLRVTIERFAYQTEQHK